MSFTDFQARREAAWTPSPGRPVAVMRQGQRTALARVLRVSKAGKTVEVQMPGDPAPVRFLRRPEGRYRQLTDPTVYLAAPLAEDEPLEVAQVLEDPPAPKRAEPATWRLKRTKQCAKCPWRKGVDPHTIPNGYSVDKHRALESTIAREGELSFDRPAMACHETHDAHCIGWLVNQLGRGNNIAMRLRIRSCENAREIELRVAASSDTHARLRAGIPAVADSRRMAEDYLEAFRGFLAHPPEPATAGAQPAKPATAEA